MEGPTTTATPLLLLCCLCLSLLLGSSDESSVRPPRWYTTTTTTTTTTTITYNNNNYRNPRWRSSSSSSSRAFPRQRVSQGRPSPWQYDDLNNWAPVVLVVDQSGHGDFTTVQSAIDSVPPNNMKWVSIQINSGTYREKVVIPKEKPYILLKGRGKRTTTIVWNDHSSIENPTFKSLADNIIVKSISFVNSYNYPSSTASSKNQILPAVAAEVSGDKTSFYGCGFRGVQDTLWDNAGRHYFKRCTIEGAVDFIFGSGQSIYEECEIKVVGGGFITAQARERPEDSSGFVFKGCRVSGIGTAYLGRPWRSFARVLFYKSNFSQVVDPKGWNPWNLVDQNGVTYAEYGNFGPGADTSHRVSWEKKLSVDVWEKMTSMSFINQDGWLEKQPY